MIGFLTLPISARDRKLTWCHHKICVCDVSGSLSYENVFKAIMKRKKVLLLCLLGFLISIAVCQGVSSTANGKAAGKGNIVTGEPKDNFAPRPAYLNVTKSVEKHVVHKDNVKPSQSAKEEDSTQDGPRDKLKSRVTEEERPSAQKETSTKNGQARMTAHYEIGSSGIRWKNIAHDLGNKIKENRKWRFRKKRKVGSDVPEEGQENGDDAEDTTNLSLPIIIGLTCGGSLVFLFILTVLVCLWKKCRKRCWRSQQKDPELGMSASSRNHVTIKISEDKMLFEKSAVVNKEQSQDYPAKLEPETSSSQTLAWIVDFDIPKTEAITVFKIPEPSFQENSFNCPFLSGLSTGTAPQSSHSSVSLEIFGSKVNSGTQPSLATSSPDSSPIHHCFQSLPSLTATAMSSASEPNISSGSPISLSAINLTFPPEVSTETPACVSEIRLNLEPELSTSDLSPAPTPNCTAKETVVSIAETSFDQDFLQSSSSVHPTAFKESVIVNVCSSGELSGLLTTSSVTTDTNSSSTENFKNLTVDYEATDGAVTDILTGKDKTHGKPPTPPSLTQPPKATTNIQKGKSLIGGQKALENRRFIKHLTSKRYSTGLEGDLSTAISRILGEKKRDVDQNREKRIVIKHQTEETKFSFNESILRSKAVIMDENVLDKKRKRLLSVRRQAIKRTLNVFPGQNGVQTKRKLAREIKFAKAIISSAERNPTAAWIARSKRCDGPAKSFLKTGAHICNPDTKAQAVRTYSETNTIPERFVSPSCKMLKPKIQTSPNKSLAFK